MFKNVNIRKIPSNVFEGNNFLFVITINYE